MKYYINLFVSVIILSVLLSQNTNSRVLLDKVVAVVNDDIITLVELEAAEEQINKTTPNKVTREQALEQLIDRTLIEQQAKDLGITVSDSEVESTMEVLRQRYNLQGDEMAKALKEQNMTEEEFREQWKYQLLTKKVLDNKLKGRIAITPEEVEEYYRENYGEIESADEIRISQILVRDEVKANEVAELARAGDDFPKLAEQYSIDEISAPAGGDLGYFRQGDLVETLANAVEGLDVGQIAGPVETESGYHILKVTDRKSAEEGIPESTIAEIKDTLYEQKVQKELQEWLTTVKEKAYIERKI